MDEDRDVDDANIQKQNSNNEPKKKCTQKIPKFRHCPLINELVFGNPQTLINIFLELLGPKVDHILFQSNLYAIEKWINVNLTRQE